MYFGRQCQMQLTGPTATIVSLIFLSSLMSHRSTICTTMGNYESTTKIGNGLPDKALVRALYVQAIIMLRATATPIRFQYDICTTLLTNFYRRIKIRSFLHRLHQLEPSSGVNTMADVWAMLLSRHEIEVKIERWYSSRKRAAEKMTETSSIDNGMGRPMFVRSCCWNLVDGWRLQELTAYGSWMLTCLES